MRRNEACLTPLDVGERHPQAHVLRLLVVLRNALVLCEKFISHWNFFYKNTWPEFQPSLPRGQQVYALFDRRCRTQTALAKLAKSRRRVQRFPALGETLKKLFAPTLEKALTFLDETPLPSTSNAVERGNRRYRKMQKQRLPRTHASANQCTVGPGYVA